MHHRVWITASCAIPHVWLIESVIVLNASTAERVGFLKAASRNPNKEGPLSLKPHDRSDLSSSDLFVGFRLFASAYGFCPAQ